MAKVRFQNGAAAPHDLLLDVELADDASASEKKAALAKIVEDYGTVEDAVAWLDGDTRPKHLDDAEEIIPALSSLSEVPPQAPPSPEVLAKEAKRLEKADAENQAARDEAAKAHADALAKQEADAKEADAKAKAADKK